MGQAEYGAISSLLTGNVALFFGLLLTLFGLYQMLVARNTTLGVIMICVGLCIPYTQNIMGGLQSAFCPTITTLGGQCAGFSMGTTGVGGIGSK